MEIEVGFHLVALGSFSSSGATDNEDGFWFLESLAEEAHFNVIAHVSLHGVDWSRSIDVDVFVQFLHFIDNDFNRGVVDLVSLFALF